MLRATGPGQVQGSGTHKLRAQNSFLGTLAMLKTQDPTARTLLHAVG